VHLLPQKVMGQAVMYKKMEIHSVLHCRQSRTKQWPQETCTENLKFGLVVFEICSYANRHTQTYLQQYFTLLLEET